MRWRKVAMLTMFKNVVRIPDGSKHVQLDSQTCYHNGLERLHPKTFITPCSDQWSCPKQSWKRHQNLEWKTVVIWCHLYFHVFPTVPLVIQLLGCRWYRWKKLDETQFPPGYMEHCEDCRVLSFQCMPVTQWEQTPINWKGKNMKKTDVSNYIELLYILGPLALDHACSHLDIQPQSRIDRKQVLPLQKHYKTTESKCWLQTTGIAKLELSGPQVGGWNSCRQNRKDLNILLDCSTPWS